MDVNLLPPDQRAMIFHVDQFSAFYQKVGRQHQQQFFEKLLRPDLFNTISRTVFEITLAPPATSPTLRLLSQNVVRVSEKAVNQGETAQLDDGALLDFCSPVDRKPFLKFSISLVRSQSRAAVAVTCANLPVQAPMHGHDREPATILGGQAGVPIRGGGYGGPFPAAAHAPGSFENSSRPTTLDSRPPTMPQYPTGNLYSARTTQKAALECIHSASTQDLSNSVITLIPGETITIGRMHQIGFFEKLLPDHESLTCISRSHVAVNLRSGGQSVEVTNLSPNAINVDGQILQKQQKGELKNGASLTFTAHTRKLLEFQLRL
jgi:hypothetical protein